MEGDCFNCCANLHSFDHLLSLCKYRIKCMIISCQPCSQKKGPWNDFKTHVIRPCQGLSLSPSLSLQGRGKRETRRTRLIASFLMLRGRQIDSLIILSFNNKIFTDDFVFCCLQDYWLSLLYKRLVGVKVLHVDGGTEEKRKIRVYAHCSSRYKINNDSATGGYFLTRG